MAKRKALGLIDEAVEGVKDLLFMHNTNAKKLARQDAIGGLPNPSIAVTQKDIPFEGFGDITLVGKPDRFDPAMRGNPMYSADAYTVRSPAPVRLAKSSATNDFDNDFRAYREFGNVDNPSYNLSQLKYKSNADPYDFGQVDHFLEYDTAASVKFFNDIGVDVPRKQNGDIDRYALSELKMQYADKFDEWKDGLMNKYFEPDEYFVTNPDYDRYSGRPNLKPYTAENLSKWMNKNAGAGKESTVTFGAGNLRASTTEQIKSLQEAKQRKGILKSGEEVSVAKSTANEVLSDLQDALRDYYKYDTGSFYYYDEVGRMIADSEKIGLERALKKYDFENVPKELIQEIEDYKGYLRSAPTEYFESKPQRPVQLSDFGGAIVPENTPKGLIDRLTDAGLRVEKYGDEAERVAARDKFKDLMFVRPEAAITAGLLTAGALSSDRANAGLLSTGTKVARSVADETKRLIDMGYPESVAKRIASGELDMSPQARLARQQEAFPDIVYHGSMQDIVGEYIPKYQDNLMFTTPDPEFASDWAGKGAMQTRAGELDAFDRYRPQKQKLYEEFGSPEYGTPEYDEFSKKAAEIYNQERNAFKTLYPLAVKAKNPFDPTAEGMYEKVTEPLFKKKFGVEKLDPSTEEYLRKGAYLYFEDPDVIKELQDMGYDAIKLRESTDGPLNTLAMFDGSKNVRSLLSAAFDPKYTGSNIMGSRVIPTVATGLLGASVLGSALAPQKAQAGGLSLLDNLLKAGYPESVAKRIASGELPMDEASRMARAEAQGLNTDELLYHWTNRDFNEFVPSETGKYASGIYASPNKWYGEKYVESGTPKRMELLARGDIAEMSDIAEVEPIVRSRIQELKPQGSNFGHVYWSLINDELKKKGFSGLRMDNEVVVFDPSDIRSPNAAFDPEYTGPNIMGSRVIPTAGLLAAGAMAPEDAEAGALSRLARAREQGFTQRAFMGVRDDMENITQLDPDVGVGARSNTGNWMAQNPIQAETYATQGTMPFRLNTQNYATVDFGGTNWNDRADFLELELPNGETVNVGGMDTNEIARTARELGVDGVQFEQITDLGPKSSKVDRQGLMDYYDSGDTQFAVFNPASARSEFAQFDPNKVGSRDILAARPEVVVPAGLIAAAALAPDQAQAQELDPNLPLTIGSPKQEVNYETMPSYYDYGDGATIPVRPPEPVRETRQEYLPAGMPVNPYTFMMSTGADQGEAARYVTDAYTNIARGAGNAIGGVGGEMEALGKGLMYAIAGQGMGGSPWGRLMHVLDKYNPQLPNTQDVGRLPALLPNVSPMTEEERRMHQLAGETMASFYLP